MENNINQLKKKSSIKTSSSAKRYYIKSLIAIAVFLLVITLELVILMKLSESYPQYILSFSEHALNDEICTP